MKNQSSVRVKAGACERLSRFVLHSFLLLVFDLLALRADFTSIRQGVASLLKNKTIDNPEFFRVALDRRAKQENRIGPREPFDAELRVFTGYIKDSIDALDSYGCWCYFSVYGQGKGQPLSLIDQNCRALHEGYECARMDLKKLESQECLPWQVPYASGHDATGERDLLFTECQFRNQGDLCATYACTVEGNFILSFLNIVVNSVGEDVTNENYLHAAGFDPALECERAHAALYSEKECCGTYPLRRPYKLFNGERACCGGHVYATSVYTCCDDEVSLVC